MRTRALLILALLAAPGFALGVDKMFQDPTLRPNEGFEDDGRGWQEGDARLPAYPTPANLVRFEVAPTARNEHFIDLASLSGGEDGVVRYALVIKSPSGTETVSYEGIRCENGERKVYAYGRAKGEWSKNRRANWSPIPMREANNPQRVLFFHYFCTINTKRDVPALQDILRSGGIYQN